MATGKASDSAATAKAATPKAPTFKKVTVAPAHEPSMKFEASILLDDAGAIVKGAEIAMKRLSDGREFPIAYYDFAGKYPGVLPPKNS